MQDQIILGAINSTLTEKMLMHVTWCTTSKSARTTLETLFTSHTKARTMQVHFQLASLKKGNSTIVYYFQKFQALVDALAIVGKPIDDFEQQAFLLAGLGLDYDPFVTSITTRADPLSIEALYGHLLTHEMRLDQNQTSVALSVFGTNIAAHGSSFRGGRGSSPFCPHASCGLLPSPHGYSSSQYSRGRGRGRYSSSASHPICQLCQKPSHVTYDYYQQYKNGFQRDSAPPMNAFVASPSNTVDANWYPESGASHHLTLNLVNLNITTEDYNSFDQIHVGNGTGLSKHIGNAKIFIPTSHFFLQNVLHVPHITKNLLYVHQFTKSTNTYFEFHPFHFFVKDHVSGKILLHGRSNNGLYSIPTLSSSNKSPSASALMGERTTISDWHSRLGHPALQVVCRLLSRFQLPFKRDLAPASCSACLCDVYFK
jgi:hypothetical protein